MDNIKFLDLVPTNNKIKDKFMSEMSNLYDSGNFIKGKYCKVFEDKFKSMHSAKYCLALNNGTSALHSAIEAIKLEKRNINNVVIAENTFMAQLEAINISNVCRTTVVKANDDYLIDESSFDEPSSTIFYNSIVIFTSLYGNYKGLKEVIELCKTHETPIIIDNAQGMVNDYLIDCIKDYDNLIVTYSHYAGKNIGSIGEAGSIITNNEKYYNTINKFISHGSDKKYVHEILGHNYRMDEVTGLFMSLKLDLHEEILSYRINNFKYYNESITNDLVKLPNFNDTHTVHQYVVEVNDRDAFMDYLSYNGIPTMIHYPKPVNKIYNELKNDENLNTFLEYYSNNVNYDKLVSIPVHENLSREQIEHIVNTINKFMKD